MGEYRLNKFSGRGYPIKIGILYWAGTDPDLVDSVESGKALEAALLNIGHRVNLQEVTKYNWERAIGISADVVFNLVEDQKYFYYKKVARGLELLGKSQVGHDLNVLKYSVNKILIKKTLNENNISTPRFAVVDRKSKLNKLTKLKYPLIVKPVNQHAGIGISQFSVVTNHSDLVNRIKYLLDLIPGKVILEEYIPGREIHVTVLGNGNNIITLPPCEINFGGRFCNNWKIYSYEAKWDEQCWEFWDARITTDLDVKKSIINKIERLSMDAYRVLGCRDIARMDIRLSEMGVPYLVDVNYSPSVNKYDEQDATVMSAEAIGWSYETLIETIVMITYKRKFRILPDRIRERSFLLTSPSI